MPQLVLNLMKLLMPLSLAVAFVAVRFPPALDDEVVTWWDSSHFPAGVNAGFARLHSLASW